MTCKNARDTITQSAGKALSNFYEYASDSGHVVTSYCRVPNGTWVAWKNNVLGQSLAAGDTLSQDAAASALAIGVGFFPDDESAPVVYELGVDPSFGWNTIPVRRTNLCGYWGPIESYFDDYARSDMQSWSMDLLDVQVRSDGTNVWVISLARESVLYPYIFSHPFPDRCGTVESLLIYPSEWALDGQQYWLYGPGELAINPDFGNLDIEPYWDVGPDESQHWQPARITVWAGDIGGFTRIDTVEADFNNSVGFGLCGPLETCASPAEPGVLHVVWSEAGYFGPKHGSPSPIGPLGATTKMRGQRISYSQWSSSAKLLDTDLAHAYEPDGGDPFTAYAGSAYNADDNWVYTSDYILRNDHGSPCLLILPWRDGNNGPSGLEYWDISDGSPVVLQTLDPSLFVTAGEAGTSDTPVLVGNLFTPAVVGSFGAPRRVHFASSLYTDPLLTDRNVYLLCIRSAPPATTGADVVAFYRIPCDGSDTFDFMDSVRKFGYSILNDVLFTGNPTFPSDFVSDPDNVWMPADGEFTNGEVQHLYRRCQPAWELVEAFPDPSPQGFWAIGAAGVPVIVTDSDGDWLAGGGNGPFVSFESAAPTDIAALRAKICRCCVPCPALGVRLWKRV